MTLNELDNKIIVLRNQFDNDVRLLKASYCNSNNPYKVGYIFTDHIGSIIIENIKPYFVDEPCCVYYGVELKKKMVLQEKMVQNAKHGNQTKRNKWKH